MMKAGQSKPKSTSAQGTVSTANKGGVLLTPTVLVNRQEIEPAATPTLTHGVVGSDATLGGAGAEGSEKEKKHDKKDKQKAQSRISKFFKGDTSGTAAASEQPYHLEHIPRRQVQPSKAGVLSNLLKLQGNIRHPKVKTWSSFDLI
jgi:hypothetical protein